MKGVKKVQKGTTLQDNCPLLSISVLFSTFFNAFSHCAKMRETQFSVVCSAGN